MTTDPRLSPSDKAAQQVVVPQSVLRSGLSRRGMLKAMGLLGGGSALAAGAASAWPTDGAAAGTVAYALPDGFTGTIADLKHVVILMQENRSFDHYYGAMPGVRGFNDKQGLRFPNGTDVFSQPSGSSVVKPKHVTTVAQTTTGLAHDYGTGTGAWNAGRYNNWIPAKGSATMNYLTGEEIPWQWSLASTYTLCDNYHCSVMGPTTPNRLYLWTGTSNGVTSNGGETSGNRAWQTYPEALQAAGVSWRVYVDNNNGDGWRGDYEDNPIRGFATFTPSAANLADPVKTAPGTGVVWRANSFPYAPDGLPNDDSDTNLDGVLGEFIKACAPGAEHPLPQVSWIVAPYEWSEHPSANPEHGAHYTNRVIKALQSNPDIWNHTLLILNFDENDGYFDHVLPPAPEAGTAGEFSGSTPIGYGARVPMTLVSPWTRGGWVNSEVFDHTSVIRFLEVWTASLGTPALSTTITPWRRAVSGDLTSAIDFTRPVLGVPSLPDTAALVAIARAGGTIANQVPSEDKWTDYPALRPRPLPFHPHGTFSENRATGKVTAHLSLAGGPAGKAVSLQVFPDKYKAFGNTPYTVTATAGRDHTWDAAAYQGRYAFSVYGPDGFVRSHAGTVLPAGQNNAGVPRVDVDLVTGTAPTVAFTLHNDGLQQVRYTLTANDHVGGVQNLWVAPGATQTVDWPTADGYYDVVLTADTGTGWKHRYAGRVARTSA
ncbi:alkaline phosphatase family protein [Kitasatospora sp. NPDC049285]|uniref:alkaline phosphatase family protein n=1 Tax=Kitasatospora sp. NPDC049285 TaxID=3157096 RepID=UPI00343D4D17